MVDNESPKPRRCALCGKLAKNGPCKARAHDQRLRAIERLTRKFERNARGAMLRMKHWADRAEASERRAERRSEIKAASPALAPVKKAVTPPALGASVAYVIAAKAVRRRRAS